MIFRLVHAEDLLPLYLLLSSTVFRVTQPYVCELTNSSVDLVAAPVATRAPCPLRV